MESILVIIAVGIVFGLLLFSKSDEDADETKDYDIKDIEYHVGKKIQNIDDLAKNANFKSVIDGWDTAVGDSKSFTLSTEGKSVTVYGEKICGSTMNATYEITISNNSTHTFIMLYCKSLTTGKDSTKNFSFPTIKSNKHLVRIGGHFVRLTSLHIAAIDCALV